MYRDYAASHAVTVTGFVSAPGAKTLRREAVPLYAILAEALVLPRSRARDHNPAGPLADPRGPQGSKSFGNAGRSRRRD